MTLFFSLRFRLTLLVLIALLPALILVIYTGIDQRRHEADQAVRDARQTLQRASEDLDDLIEQSRALLGTLARLPAVHNQDPTACRQVFGELLQEHPYYTGFTVILPDGNIACAVPEPAPGTNASDRAYFQQVKSTHRFVASEYLTGRTTGKPIMVLAIPVLDASGNLQAILTVGITLSWFDTIAAQEQLPSGAELTLIDRHGAVLAHSPEPERWRGLNVSDAPIVQTILAQRSSGTAQMAGLNGVEQLSVWEPLGNDPALADTFLMIGIPSTVAFAHADAILTRNLIALAGVAVLALLAARLFGEWGILWQTGQLSLAAQRLARGDLTARTGLSASHGELGQLAETFDDMASALQAHEAARARAEQILRRYELLAQHSRDIILFMHRDGKILEVNQAACAAYGYSREELLSLTIFDLRPPDTLPEASQRMAEADAGGTLFETVHQRKDGSTFPVEVSSRGETIGGKRTLISVIRDITERKRAEAEIEHLASFPQLNPNPTLEVDQFGCVTYANDAARRVVERLALGDVSVFLPSDLPAIIETLAEKGTDLVYREIPIGDRVYSLSLYRAGDFKTTRLYTHDITERKRAEEALRESERRYRSLFENMLNGVAYCRMIYENGVPQDFIYVAVNGAFTCLTGLKDVQGKRVTQVIPGIKESNPELFALYARVTETGKPESFETYVEPLGIWLYLSVYRAEPEHFVAVFDNITARKEAEQALKIETERFRRFTESNIIGIAIADTAGNIIMVNDYSLNLLGVSRQEFEAGEIQWTNFTPPEWLPADQKAIQQLRERGICEPYEKEFVRRDGTRVPVYLADAMLPGPGELIASFALDFTDRKRAEETLRESEERFSGAFEHAPIGMSLVSLDGRWLRVNRALCELVGYEPGELLSMTFQDISHPDDLEADRAYTQLLLEGEIQTYQLEKRYFHKQGFGVWSLLSVSLIRDRHGSPLYFVSQIQDITKRKRAEEALRESERKFTTIFDQIPVAASLSRFPAAVISDVNEAFERAFGYTEQQVVGKTTLELGMNTDTEGRARIGAQLQAQGSVRNVELKLRTKSGVARDFLVNIDLVNIGAQRYILQTAHDITALKRAEEALQLEIERFRRFTESNIIGIIIGDAAGNLSLANDYYLKILGVTRQEFDEGKVQWTTFTPPEWRLSDEKAIRELRERGVSEPHEKEYIRADGTRVPVYIVDTVLPGPDEQLGAFVLDISERKQAEQALQRLTEELRRSNAELEQFAYVASHDLQEPLRMVSSYVQLLKRRYQNKLDADADEFIHYAVDGATRMQGLINDLLSYSRVGTRGKPFAPVALDTALDHALNHLQIALDESHAQIRRLPLPTVTGDQGQITQVFQNLIANALKFHGEAAPQICVSAQRVENEWVVSVKDNGIGIDPQYRERIFVLFQRLHSREDYPGTGIGLTICKKIVERHGGRIWVESHSGQGATFCFTLPAGVIAEGHVAQAHGNGHTN